MLAKWVTEDFFSIMSYYFQIIHLQCLKLIVCWNFVIYHQKVSLVNENADLKTRFLLVYSRMMSLGILSLIKSGPPKASQYWLTLCKEISLHYDSWQSEVVNFKDKNIILKAYILENFDLKIDLDEYLLFYLMSSLDELDWGYFKSNFKVKHYFIYS